MAMAPPHAVVGVFVVLIALSGASALTPAEAQDERQALPLPTTDWKVSSRLPAAFCRCLITLVCMQCSKTASAANRSCTFTNLALVDGSLLALWSELQGESEQGSKIGVPCASARCQCRPIS